MLGSRLPTFTLFTALLLALASPVYADANTNDQTNNLLARRGEHARMIKRYSYNNNSKRLLGDIFGFPSTGTGSDQGSINAAPDPNAPAAGDAGATTPSGSVTTPGTAATPPAHGGGLGGALGGVLGGGQTDTNSNTVSPTDSGTVSPTGTTTDSESLSTTTTPPAETHTTLSHTITSPTASSSTPSVTRGPSTVTVSYEDPVAQAAKESNRDYQSSLSRISPHVRTILIAVAASIVGLAIIWTVVRKWKFRSSRSFQDRLAPIDWQPDSDKPNGAAPTGAMTEAGSDNASIRRNMFAPDDALAPPAHDFTAGPGPYRSASPLPYGGGRTASPAPQALYRAPSNGSGRQYDPARGY